MKKIFTFLTLLFIAVALVGCKPPEGFSTIDSKDEYIESGATNIVMWCADFEEWQNQLNVKQRMDFNSIKDDGIQLSQVFVEQNDIDDRLRAARESQSVPDIYMISIGNLYKEVQNGYALDITSYIDTWNDLIDSAFEGVTYGGKHYGYPICLEPSTLLFYRKDLLSEYGNTTTIPTKWDELLELCATIKANIKAKGVKGLYPFDVPKGVDCAWGTWGMQVAATGGLAVDDTWSESRLLTTGKDGYTKLGELWDTLFDKGYVPLSSGAYNEYIKQLCLDKQVMSLCGSWSVSEIINAYPELKDKIGIAKVPTFTGVQTGTLATNGGWVYVVSSECKNVEKAIEVIKWLVAGNDTSRTEYYFSKAYYSKSSPRKSVQAKIEESLKTQKDVPTEWVELINEVTTTSILEPIYPWDISVAIEGYLEACAMGKGVEASLIEADTAVKNIILNNHTSGTNPRN